MTKDLLSTRDIGSGPRDPAIVGLLRPVTLTEEQITRATSFLNRVETLPEKAYGAHVESTDRPLAEEYTALAHQDFTARIRAATSFVVKIGVVTLHNLGFGRSWDLEWTRSEMVQWECTNVPGFSESQNWQHSYGHKFWKPREINGRITFSSAQRHIEELLMVQQYAKEQLRVPLTDPHCIIHANDNLYYYGKTLEKEKDEVLAGLKGDHAAGLDFARNVSRERVRAISRSARTREKIDIQWDNFIVACERKEFDRRAIKRMGLKVPSYIELLKESTPSYPNIEYSIHNCLQPYHLYVPYLPAEVPSVTRFHFEISTHDTNKRGLTADQRTGQGWEAIRQLKQYGLRKHQKAIIDVASTYEGAQPPDPEVVRDRILYPILRLDYAPEQIEVAPACGQRNLSLERMLEIDVNIHKGRDLALKQLEREFKIDAEPHLTKSRLERVKGR